MNTEDDEFNRIEREAAMRMEAVSATVAKREWVGLTESEVSQIIDEEIGFNSCWGPEEAFAKAIEAKLKEKNEM
jgi:hypothetical protein